MGVESPMLRIDCHTHVMQGQPEELVARSLQSGVDRLNVLGIPALCGPGNNFDCARVKALRPGKAYAFAGLVWQGQTCPDPREQLRLAHMAGFDGLKLIESKPNLQKELNFHPQDPHFEGMFSLAEKQGIPILWHVGDPASFWSVQSAPAFAVENGWTYEGAGFCSLQELYMQTEALLARHPGLLVVLAHFYFCSDDAQHLERLFARFPNLRIDITPGVEMYHSFAKDPAFWQDFFEKHHQRILMGSDMTDEAGDESHLPLGRIIRGMLLPQAFEEWDIKAQGFDLSKQALQAIWAGNFEALCPGGPRAMDVGGLRALMDFYQSQLDGEQVKAALLAYKELCL